MGRLGARAIVGGSVGAGNLGARVHVVDPGRLVGGVGSLVLVAARVVDPGRLVGVGSLVLVAARVVVGPAVVPGQAVVVVVVVVAPGE